MPINLSSSLQPLSVGPAPSGPSLGSLNIPVGSSAPSSGSSVWSKLLGLGSSVLGSSNPLLGLGLNFASSLFGNWLNRRSQNNVNEANLNLAKMQNEWNYKMWQENNEYNSPKNQVKRLQEAGINPMLAMGQISSSPSTALQSADLANQQFNQLGFPNLSDSYLAWQSNEIARKNAETQRMAVEADIPLKKREALKMDSEMDKLQAEILKIQAEEQKILSDENLNKQKIEYQKVANEYFSLYGDEDYISRINSQEASAEFQRESKKWLGTHAKAARDSAKAALNNSSNMKQLYENLAKESQQRIDNFNVQVDKWVEEGKLTKEQAKYMKKQNEHYEENQKLKWIQAAVGVANTLNKMDLVSSPEI